MIDFVFEISHSHNPSESEGREKVIKMSNTLPVRITSRKIASGEVYEGTVTMCGGRPFKLERKADKSTQFPNRSAVVAAARNFAKTYGFADVNFGEQTAQKTKAAAKTSATSKTTATTKKAAKKSSVNTNRTSAPTQTTTQVSRPQNSR